MTAATSVLLAVATELAQQAKSSMPEMREGERIRREGYESGVYYRKTSLGDKLFLCQYDFRQRKSRREAVVE